MDFAELNLTDDQLSEAVFLMDLMRHPAAAATTPQRVYELTDAARALAKLLIEAGAPTDSLAAIIAEIRAVSREREALLDALAIIKNAP